MTKQFVRTLGYQPGVQLNPLRDNTNDGIQTGNADQVVAVVGRFTRGRIDKPFLVDLSNWALKLGNPESLAAQALAECRLQVYECLNKGAQAVLVSRLVPAAAALQWVNVITGSGATTFTTTNSPNGSATVSFRHLACHNDGIKVSIHADAAGGGSPVASKSVRVKILLSNGSLLYDVSGSLDSAAVDDYGQSTYLPDVVGRYIGDILEVNVPASVSVATDSDCYGVDGSGNDLFATSAVKTYFTESGTTYSGTDYDRAVNALAAAPQEFGNIMTGGSRAVSLIAKLAALAYQVNTPLVVNVGGDLSPSAAIAFVASLNIDSHLVTYYWAPIKADDPLTGGRATWGVEGIQAGLRCRRNAQTNAFGFAPKNYPIAGKDWPVDRVRIRQIYNPTENELSDLGKAHINPVIFTTYNGGSAYVFTDSLTGAASQVSFRKLTAVAEMSVDIDDRVTKFGKEVLQLPMAVAIKKMTNFVQKLLENAQASGWLVPSEQLAGAAFTFTVTPNASRPADRMDVGYWLRFDGTTRAVYVTQTISP
jgi:hypothetical protein